jgi:hypothetical protein
MSYNAKNYTEQGSETTHFGGKVIFEDGSTVEGLPEPAVAPATASTLGGIKVGSGLSVTEDGTLSADGITPAEAVAASEASDVAGVNTVLNAVIVSLKAAGLMAADEE